MYHTEGYLDRQTYVRKDRIFSFALAKGRNQCYFWCVVKKGEYLGHPESGNISAYLENWFYQELALHMEKGPAAIRRELNCFGEKLERHNGVYGRENALFLCLYFQGQIYTYGEDGHGIWRFQERRGLYLWTYPAFSVIEEALPERYGAIEEEANSLQAGLLKRMSEGKLGQGFFFMWEDAYDF